MRGLHPVYLVQCLFLLYSLFLCVAYAAEASFDIKGLLEAVQQYYSLCKYNKRQLNTGRAKMKRGLVFLSKLIRSRLNL
jgi:hypothetical protein